MVDGETFLYRGLLVVVALYQGLARDVVLAFDLRRIEYQVVGSAGSRVDTTPAHAPDDFLVTDINLKHIVKLDALGT